MVFLKSFKKRILHRFFLFDDIILFFSALGAIVGWMLSKQHGVFTVLFFIPATIFGVKVRLFEVHSGTVLLSGTLLFIYFLLLRVAFTLWKGLLHFKWRLRFFTVITEVQSIYLHELLLAFTHWGASSILIGSFRDFPEFMAFYTHYFTALVFGCLMIQVLIVLSILKEKSPKH